MVNSAVEAFIDRHGVATLAEAVGKKAGTVRLWRHRHVIPRCWWPELTSNVEGVTIAELVEVEALSKPFAERRKAS